MGEIYISFIISMNHNIRKFSFRPFLHVDNKGISSFPSRHDVYLILISVDRRCVDKMLFR